MICHMWYRSKASHQCGTAYAEDSNVTQFMPLKIGITFWFKDQTIKKTTADFVN
jgi:hypothetical protein